MPYEVTCTICTFEREIEALDDVFEFRDQHQNTYGPGHRIEFERLEETGGEQ